METCPNRTAALNALPVGTIIKDAFECGDGVINALTLERNGELVARLVVRSEHLDHDVTAYCCWPWWIDTADEDLDDPARIAEWQIEPPQTDG